VTHLVPGLVAALDTPDTIIAALTKTGFRGVLTIVAFRDGFVIGEMFGKSQVLVVVVPISLKRRKSSPLERSIFTRGNHAIHACKLYAMHGS